MQTNLAKADVIFITIGSNDLLNECKRVVQEILKTDTKFKSADEALASLKESVKKNPLLVLSAINALNNWDYNSFEKEWIQMMKTVNSLKKDDAKVIVTTIYNPAGNMKLPSTLNKIVEDIIENMNAIIEKRAGKYDYEVADVYQSSVTSHLQKDGVHPRAKITRSKGTVLLWAIPVTIFSADFSPIRSNPLMSSIVSLYKSAVL